MPTGERKFPRVRGRIAACATIGLAAAALIVALLAVGEPPAGAATGGVVNAIGTENEYADVLSQIGGPYVHVSAILDNPNTDPHTFEASPSVASEVSNAQLVVQNGVGYDTWMNHILSASPNSHRKVIVVQHLLGLPTDTPNPHLWYMPRTMPLAAKAMAAELESLDPAHKSYFVQSLKTFDHSLQPWFAAIAAFKAQYRGTAVATTEPVADYLLTAMGLKNLTPFSFQANIMNGVDPAPQNVSLENSFFTKHQVKVFCYNQQVVDALTTSIRQTAEGAGVPVVGVYETMPTPSYHYQTWMLAEVNAIGSALTSGVSTEHL